MDTIGKRIKFLRGKYKVSQAKLAKGAGVQRGNISHYELGDWNPNYETTKKIADFFNVDPDWLYYGDEIPNYNVNISHTNTYISCNVALEHAVQIGKKISYIRLKSGMTEDKFAEILKIDTKALAEFEEGKIPIPSYVLYVIYKKFNINPAFLLDPEVVSDKNPEEDISRSTIDLEKESLYFYNKLPEEEKEEISKLILWKYEKLSKRGQSSTLNNGEGEEAVTKEMA